MIVLEIAMLAMRTHPPLCTLTALPIVNPEPVRHYRQGNRQRRENDVGSLPLRGVTLEGT
jgi:hypothetical protein